MEIAKETFIGCLLGGAVGDALGYPVEFLNINEILDKCGVKGIQDLEVKFLEGKALISDDTQMTLFTVEGIINSKEYSIAKSTYYSYIRWLHTQGYPLSDEHEWLAHENLSSLLNYKELFSQRSPGNSCLTALIHPKNNSFGTIENRVNNSKGCGGIMRVAPAGLYNVKNNKEAFNLGCQLAAITHGHPTGYIAAGAFSSIISDICSGLSIEESVNNAIEILKQTDESEETLEAINKAVILAEDGKPNADKVAKLGEGWIAEEALSIAIYCALSYPNDFKKALELSVNHSGDSDSTGAICGNIIGAKLGADAIPKEWIDDLELAELVEEMAEKLYDVCLEKIVFQCTNDQ